MSAPVSCAKCGKPTTCGGDCRSERECLLCPECCGAAMSEPTYPCEKCGALRTMAEGGTVFTVCDACWPKVTAWQPLSTPTNEALVPIAPPIQCGPSCQHPTHAVGAPDELDYWRGQYEYECGRRAEAEAERDDAWTETDILADVCMAFAFDMGLNAKRVCSFCNAEYGWNDLAGVEQHMLECSRHPTARLQARVAELEAENERLRGPGDPFRCGHGNQSCERCTDAWSANRRALEGRLAALEAACGDALVVADSTLGTDLAWRLLRVMNGLRAALEGQ